MVEVSPSTVTWLKVRSTTRRHPALKASWGTRASVTRKASMVAMLGWIMPLPLARPTILAPATSASATLGRVSVVRMASAKASAKG